MKCIEILCYIIIVGRMGGSGPPTYVQTPAEISAKPLNSFFYI